MMVGNLIATNKIYDLIWDSLQSIIHNNFISSEKNGHFFWELWGILFDIYIDKYNN